MAMMVSTMAVCAAFGSGVGTLAACPQARDASHNKTAAMIGDFLNMVLLWVKSNDNTFVKERSKLYWRLGFQLPFSQVPNQNILDKPFSAILYRTRDHFYR
jgi:hypothetical protein